MFYGMNILFTQKFSVFFGEYWFIDKKTFLVIQIQCLEITKQQKIFSSSINMNNFLYSFSLSCLGWILLSYRAFDIFFWVDIVPDMLIYFSFYLDSVSWNNKILVKWLQLHNHEEFPPFFLPYCRVWASWLHRDYNFHLLLLL